MLNSVLGQTYQNWECLIIDDGSTDETTEVAHSFSKKDKRIRYYLRDQGYSKGISGARNYGLDRINGDYIIFFDDDDIVHPENLTICINQIWQSGYSFCLYRKKSFVNDPPKFDKPSSVARTYKIGENNFSQVVSQQIPMASCTVMWKKECFEKIRFDETLHYAEEWECYTRILLKGYEGIGIPDVLYYNRKHPNSNTGEFWAGGRLRTDSNILAIKKVIGNLQTEVRFTPQLKRYFVQLSVFHGNYSILSTLLSTTKAPFLEKIKYNLFYLGYPILGRVYRLRKMFNIEKK